jgi:4-carboxymuconolactone decarboxylase
VSGMLTEREGLLVSVSAALAWRQEHRVREALQKALSGGADLVAVEEVILQSYLFLGYPAALGAFGIWREVSGRHATAATPGSWPDWRARGEQVCKRVYGGQYDGLRENIAGLHADLADWMVVEGYGKVLGRPGLELRLRELCISALLAVLDTPVQLRSHLRGALNAGASTAEVEDALARALAGADADHLQRAHDVWSAVRGRWESLAGAGSG